MIKIIKIIFLSILITVNIYPHRLDESLANSFIDALINDSTELENFVHDSELELSSRLGIFYPETKNKFLIANDIETSIKADLRNKKLKYEYKIDALDSYYSRLTFLVPAKNIKNEYYFYKSRLISKPSYFSKSWIKQKSKYFEFHISDKNLFNNYSTQKLDLFVDEMLTILNFSASEISKLREEKIHYFLCKDETEIELLTNYKARGMYYVAYDYIISTFNCHYHEILHLLINYKLQSIPLYTLPFLQEGFAVAYGGRGGKDPDVILNMGMYLARNKFIDYKSLLNKSDFYQLDASMTYPLSGLYVRFLIQSLGIEKFMLLYKKYSGDKSQINNMAIDLSELPPEEEWVRYLNNPAHTNSIKISKLNESSFQTQIIETADLGIYENIDEYLFKIREKVGLKSNEPTKDYTSKLFNELFPTKTYQNQKYIITVNFDEVSIYNLYSNNLSAKYVKGFSIDDESVNNKSGFFIFTVNKNVFDEPIERDNIISEEIL